MQTVKDTCLQIKDIARALQSNRPTPCWLLGFTGSAGRGTLRSFSDCDLLMIVSDDEHTFWRHLIEAVRFFSAVAHRLNEVTDRHVVVASSLVAQDAMPFATAERNSDRCLVLHLLIYPSPLHFQTWEAKSVREGILQSLRADRDNLLVGDTARIDMLDVEPPSRERARGASSDKDAFGVCIQPFLTGMVQAYCHDFYKSDFVRKYVFHLLRYVAKYLLPLDDRVSGRRTQVGVSGLPPASAETADDARALLEAWLASWASQEAAPLANQLASIYEAAALYFADLAQYRDRSHSAICNENGVRQRSFVLRHSERESVLQEARASTGPFYLLFRSRLNENCRSVAALTKSLAGPHCKVLYSFKTLSEAYVIDAGMAQIPDFGVAVASARELEAVARSGVPAEDILVHAPVLTPALLAMIGELPVGMISVGSPNQLRQLSGTKKEESLLLLRLSLRHLARSKFGISREDLREELGKSETPCVSGVHVHLGEELYEVAVIPSVAEDVTDAVRLLATKQHRGDIIVNLGGGLRSITCEKWLGLDGKERLRDLVTRIRRACEVEGIGTVFHFEFGRRLVADAVVGVGHVLETRYTREGAIHLLDLGQGMLPQLKSTVCGVSVLQTGEGKSRSRGILAGPACYERDCFPDCEVVACAGDVVVFSNAGAYTLSLASGFGGDRPRLRVVD